MQGFGHFQANVTAANDNCCFRILFCECLLETTAADKILDVVNIGAVYAGKIRFCRGCSGGEKQLIIWLPEFTGVIQVPYENSLAVRLDADNPVAGADIDIVFLAESLWGSGNERVFFVDQTGDVIGNASGGIGGVDSCFKYDNFRIGLFSANLRRCAHSCCIAANDDKHFSLLMYWHARVPPGRHVK